MLFVVTGPSCVGKSFLITYFTQHFHVGTVVPFTSRSPRLSESEGVHYHFRSQDELQRLSASFTHGYWTRPFNKDWYGYTSEIDKAAEDERLTIIQATSDVALRIKEKHPGCRIVFLDFDSEQVMVERIKERFSKLQRAMSDRIEHAKREKQNAGRFDKIIKDDDVFRISEKAKAYIEEQTGRLPVRKGDSGPLSDIQLIHLIRSTGSGFQLRGPNNANLENDVGGWTIDLSLSPRFFVPRRKWLSRILRRPFDLKKGDVETIQQFFVEKSIGPNRGLTLFSGEFVLGSTNEKLTLPDNIAGLISGRSSYARLGISVELSQTMIQPGHDDLIPLQLKNNLPFDIVIYPGCKIVQVALFKLSGSSSRPYGKDKKAKYFGSNIENMRSKYFEDPFFTQLKSAERKVDRLDSVIDFSQIASAVASVFMLAISVISVGTVRQTIFEGLTIAAAVLFVALLVFKHVRARIRR